MRTSVDTSVVCSSSFAIDALRVAISHISAAPLFTCLLLENMSTTCTRFCTSCSRIMCWITFSDWHAQYMIDTMLAAAVSSISSFTMHSSNTSGPW